MQILLIMLIVVLLAFLVLLLALAKQSPREKQTEDKEQEEYIRDYAETVRQTGGSMKKLEHWKVIAIYLIIYDIIAVNFSYFMALLVRFDFRYSLIPTDYFAAWRSFAPIYTIIILAVFGCMHDLYEEEHKGNYIPMSILGIVAIIVNVKPLYLFVLCCWLYLMFYAYSDIDNRGMLFAFLIAFFVFLLGRDFLQEFFKYKVENFDQKTQNHAWISSSISLLTIIIYDAEWLPYWW